MSTKIREIKREVPIEKENPYGKDLNDDMQTLLTQSIKTIINPDIEKITQAFYFCVDSHKNVKRISGEPYYTHPLKVAIILMRDFSLRDNETVIAALLHDTVEDVKGISIQIIEKKFGKAVAQIVDGVTKIKGIKTRQLDKAATYAKLFAALIKDTRVIFIKLADRFDNMRTLSFLKEKKQKAIASETLNFYSPFAQRLGLTRIRKDLEDLSLFFLDHEKFELIHDAMEIKGKLFAEYIEKFTIQVEKKLNEKKIEHFITVEHKHNYDIYNIMEQGTELKNIDNFYSLIISLKSNDFSECYTVYGLIASVFGPVSSFDDYIARPKINFYRALHSKHFGPGRKIVEVIIRTKEMDKIAANGILALYSIDERIKPLQINPQEVVEWLNWMQAIIEDGDEDAIQKIWGTIRMNLYEDHITVHLKDGYSYMLPKGSCPLDLAFAISDYIGFHFISAKVGGEVKNLNYEFHDNDNVEILTSPNSYPGDDWENYIVTNKAIVKLYNYYKENPDKKVAVRKASAKFEIKLRITGDGRQGLLEDIKNIIGKENIKRIFLNTSDSLFESIIILYINDLSFLNDIFSKLLIIKGIMGAEKIEDL